MGKGRLNVQGRFDLIAADAAFTYSGNLGAMDAQRLNPVIKPLTLIEIKSGFINKMNFSGKGNIKKATGNIAFYYKGLNVALLRKDTNATRLKRKSLVSIMANALIVKNENPIPGEHLRTVLFNVQRPVDASFFNLMWRGILYGIMETIGFGEETQKKMQVVIKQKRIEKVERIGRREDRKMKRDERRAKRNRALK